LSCYIILDIPNILKQHGVKLSQYKPIGYGRGDNKSATNLSVKADTVSIIFIPKTNILLWGAM